MKDANKLKKQSSFSFAAPLSAIVATGALIAVGPVVTIEKVISHLTSSDVFMVDRDSNCGGKCTYG